MHCSFTGSFGRESVWSGFLDQKSVRHSSVSLAACTSRKPRSCQCKCSCLFKSFQENKYFVLPKEWEVLLEVKRSKRSIANAVVALTV